MVGLTHKLHNTTKDAKRVSPRHQQPTVLFDEPAATGMTAKAVKSPKVINLTHPGADVSETTLLGVLTLHEISVQVNLHRPFYLSYGEVSS